LRILMVMMVFFWSVTVVAATITDTPYDPVDAVCDGADVTLSKKDIIGQTVLERNALKEEVRINIGGQKCWIAVEDINTEADLVHLNSNIKGRINTGQTSGVME